MYHHHRQPSDISSSDDEGESRYFDIRPSPNGQHRQLQLHASNSLASLHSHSSTPLISPRRAGPEQQTTQQQQQQQLFTSGELYERKVMENVFMMMKSEEEQNLTPESIITFLRTKLGYRGSEHLLTPLFQRLNHHMKSRIASTNLKTAAGGGSNMSRVGSRMVSRRNSNVQQNGDDSEEEKEMDLPTFIHTLQSASQEAAATSAMMMTSKSTISSRTDLHAPSPSSSSNSSSSISITQYDKEYDQLRHIMRSMSVREDDLGSLSSSSQQQQPVEGLVSVRTLKHRLGLCRDTSSSSALTSTEFTELLNLAGVVDVRGNPISMAEANDHYIRYEILLQRMSMNKPTYHHIR